jgi:hypothetical protein
MEIREYLTLNRILSARKRNGKLNADDQLRFSDVGNQTGPVRKLAIDNKLKIPEIK